MTADEVSTLLTLLKRSHALDPSSPEFLSIEQAAAHLEKSAKKKRRLARKHARAEREVLRDCYVCRAPRTEAHDSYSWMCVACGNDSSTFRALPMDLRGRRALVTGGRVKIGRATALRLLRAGAEVHVTTRFPRDAARSFATEPDFASFSARLHVIGLDFRALGQLLSAIDTWKVGPPFDIVVNNAAQSVWQPRAMFEALYAGEAPRAEHALAPFFPTDLARLDLERVDSWPQTLGQLSAVDVVEVQVVNAIAPALIVNGLRENLKRSAFKDRYVINVSALEGQFGRGVKAPQHPHTNIAKAGLNMLTRTSAEDLSRDGIFMVSVDPGWMSREGAFVPPDADVPLDADDCAARVLHPIAAGLAGAPVHGVLLKDFKEVPW